MAICRLNKSLLKAGSCGYSLPEITEIYLINHEDISGTSITSGATDGCEEITGIVFTSDAVKVAKIEPMRNTASFEDTLVVEDNGRKYRTATVSFTVGGNFDACKHGALDALSLGSYFAMVKLGNGTYVGLGRVVPLEAETATFGEGGDTSGMQIVLSGNAAESPMPIAANVVTQIKEAVATA